MVPTRCTDTEADTILHFVPTYEWQEVPPKTAVPAGLQVELHFDKKIPTRAKIPKNWSLNVWLSNMIEKTQILSPNFDAEMLNVRWQYEVARETNGLQLRTSATILLQQQGILLGVGCQGHYGTVVLKLGDHTVTDTDTTESLCLFSRLPELKILMPPYCLKVTS
tara:strand:- start:39 stop:533 length:495 start_codon:yes stop_codon:yes gene_type:complete